MSEVLTSKWVKVFFLTIYRSCQVKPVSISYEWSQKRAKIRRLVKFISQSNFRDASQHHAWNNGSEWNSNTVWNLCPALNSNSSISVREKQLCFKTVHLSWSQLFELLKLLSAIFVIIISKKDTTEKVLISWLASASYSALRSAWTMRIKLRFDYRYHLAYVIRVWRQAANLKSETRSRD